MREENKTFKETNSWIGSIPTHWNISRIKYVCKMNEKTLSEKTKDDLIIKYIDIGNVDSYGRVNGLTTYEFSKAPSRARRIVRKNDVLISTVRTYLGAIAYINERDENLVCSTGFAVLTPNEKVFPEFLGYFTRSTLFIDEIASRSYGVSYPAINSSEINSLNCILPSIEEQKLISNFLNKKTSEIDALIADKEKLIELLEEKRQAIITEAVTKGLDPDVKMKDSGVEWIGEIPEHWDIEKMKYLFKIKKRIEGLEDPNILSVTQRGIKVKDISSNEGQLATNYDKYQTVEIGDFVMNHMDLLTGFIDVSKYYGVTSPDYRVFSIKEPNYVKYYFLYYFQMSYSRRIFYKFGQGVANFGRWRLPTDEFYNFYVPVPSAEEQKEIVEHISSKILDIESVIEKTKETINKLKEYRQSLIYEAVTGKLDVQEMLKETEQEEVSSS